MPWHPLINWFFDQDVGETTMNEQIRDNLGILKTRIDDGGDLQEAIAILSANTANTGGTETDALSATLPAGKVGTNSEGFRFFFDFILANNANQKDIRFYINGVSFSLWSATTANVFVRVFGSVVRAANVAAYIRGTRLYGVNAAAVTETFMWNGSTGWASGLDFSASQIVKVTVQGVASADVTMLLGSKMAFELQA